MPATITHAFFTKDVFDILPSDIKKKLEINKIKMYGQSVDSCMFYNILSLLPGKKIRDFSDIFHKNKSQEFFINVLNYMRDNNINDIDTYSFLFGFICHYVLDSTIHPYIIYKTGILDKKNPNTYKYNNLHHFMETFIDNDMIKRRFNINPYAFDINRYVFDIKHFSKDLDKTINYSFFNTFGIKNMSYIYYKSLKQMNTFIRLFRRDRYGIKKFIYKIVDSFTPKYSFRLDALSYHYSLEDKHNYLNSDNKIWRYPTDYSITSNESYIDLYLKAIKKAKIIMCASCDFLNNKNIELEKIFDNTSYTTGIDCDSNKELKFFEF